MRGITTPVTKIRRQVFTEIARLAYEDGDYSRIEELPYTIIPGEKANYRDSVFKERAIVGERLRLAVGLPLRPVDQHAPVSQGINDSAIADMFYEPPLINVISFACNACEETSYTVTDLCRSCIAHPCTAVCPVKAVSIVNGRSYIDKSKCVNCGRCATVCPYSAILNRKRPCQNACKVKAISTDENGAALNDNSRCISCGACVYQCPFGAIQDKSFLLDAIHIIRDSENNQKYKVYAVVAPSISSQFVYARLGQVIMGLKQLGFFSVVEAALGADICKIAVMPRKRRDVVALTAACAQADDALTQPIIAISMGEMGMPTRICAEAMGSCLSFGTAGAASAPGQMEAGALREALALVHRALAREAQEF